MVNVQRVVFRARCSSRLRITGWASEEGYRHDTTIFLQLFVSTSV
jgi:hypothetical protein